MQQGQRQSEAGKLRDDKSRRISRPNAGKRIAQ
jgi:hypothetical protein